MKIVGFTGNVRRPSKTRTLVETVINRAAQRYPLEHEMFDLVDVLPEIGTTLDRRSASEKVAAVIDAVEAADVLVVGSATYKATYTGLFKHFIDLLEPERLAGKPVILTGTGGGDGHALMIDHQMRPLFAFFNAASIAHGIYGTERDFIDGEVASDRLNARIDGAVNDLAPYCPSA